MDRIRYTVGEFMVVERVVLNQTWFFVINQGEAIDGVHADPSWYGLKCAVKLANHCDRRSRSTDLRRKCEHIENVSMCREFDHEGSDIQCSNTATHIVVVEICDSPESTTTTVQFLCKEHQRQYMIPCPYERILATTKMI